MRILSPTEDTYQIVIRESIKILNSGGIVAYPTESFYALGVTISDETAVRRLYKVKKRTLQKPVPVIAGNRDIVKSIVKYIPPQAEELMKRFWPGPLTIIFYIKDHLRGVLTSNKDKIAVRIPGDSLALDLAMATNFPITATSANISGKPPAQTPDEVIDYFGDSIDLVIDAGKTPGGKPSTIVDITVSPLKILREGRIPSEELMVYKDITGS
jgi:L-threonylcarbamoyladenylate synthase